MRIHRTIFFIIIALVVVWVIYAVAQQITWEMKPKIALVRLSGPISEVLESGAFGSAIGITPAQVASWLKKAENDSSVKAVVLRVNSPGGTVAASQEIAAQIKKFKEKTKKPLIISMGDVAASGGYYISVYADKIVAQPGTTTGSIGVISLFFSIEELLQNWGIKPEIFKSGKYKDLFRGLRPLTDEERALMQQYIDEFYEQFINAVAEGRKLPPERVRELATGQVYSGAQALQLELVDELGDLERAQELARELAQAPDAITVEYRPPTPGLLEVLFGRRSETIIISEMKPEVLYVLRALEGWHAVPRY